MWDTLSPLGEGCDFDIYPSPQELVTFLVTGKGGEVGGGGRKWGAEVRRENKAGG
jgi:hypothetical protein